MNSVFLTTRYTDDIYQLIVKLCAEDIKLRDKKIKIKKYIHLNMSVKLKIEFKKLRNDLI